MMTNSAPMRFVAAELNFGGVVGGGEKPRRGVEPRGQITSSLASFKARSPLVRTQRSMLEKMTRLNEAFVVACTLHLCGLGWGVGHLTDRRSNIHED